MNEIVARLFRENCVAPNGEIYKVPDWLTREELGRLVKDGVIRAWHFQERGHDFPDVKYYITNGATATG